MRRDLDPALMRAMTRRYVIGMALYLVAFVSVAASLSPIVALALLFVLPEPTARPKATPRSRR